LDKKAEGLLVVGVGEGCKKLKTYLTCDKTYEVDIYFGVATNTDDGGGHIVEEKPIDHITREMFQTVCDEFVGEIMQVPPDYCAKTINGKRVSDRIRDGEDVKPKSCPVKIYSITVDKFKLPYARLTVKCGRGTYMRSLVRDIGIRLDSCAYMCGLLRTRQNEFKVEDAFHLDREVADDPDED
jgi:tRNA pseudouridine55 synthase